MHTFRNPLLRAELIAGDAEGFVCGDVRLTFAEFVSRCRRLGSVLADLGADRGDRVAVLAFNSIEFLELYCGVSAAGRVQVPLNFRWADPELAYALEDSGAKVLFIDRDPGPLADLVDTVVRLDTDDYVGRIDKAAEVEFDPTITPEDLAGLFYTGGTTGASKGVMLTHGNLIANTYHSQMLQSFGAGDVYQIIAPMFHAAGSNSVLQCLYFAIPQIVVPAFDPAATLDQIESEGVTLTLGVPSMLAAQVEAQLSNPRDVSSLRIYAHGGSPVPLEVIRRATQAFPTTEFLHLYGATETAPLVSGLRHEETLLETEQATSCGQTVVGVDLQILGPENQQMTDGRPGEVVVRGANVMAGYWNKPEQTAEVLQDSWYRTGDVGRVDNNGYLFLLDRSKDMIISGGENVYCTEVEDAIYTHPAVLEAAVFGIPDEKWGEAVHAVVVPRPTMDVSPDDIVAHVRQSIAGYKVPRSVELRTEELPTSGPGKVLKRELRAPYWADHDSEIA
jgi:long-chain acyl-CoA synthetase